MSNEPTRTLSPDARLGEIVAAYQAAKAAGKAPDPNELLAQHPELAAQLRPLLFGGAETPAETLAFPTPWDLGGPADVAGDALTLQPPGPPRGDTVAFRRSFGDYELLEEIARGGMGVVFKARQKSLNRIVALKMILSGHLASKDQLRRFHIEAEEAGNLDHPNIVPIFQVGEERGQHYYTMKLIEGGNLSDNLPRFRADRRGAARLLARVARAVHYAHQRGVLHRDLKPGNILLDRDGQPHVTDFGLAKHLGGQETHTQSGAIVGTPSYIAPEQAAARKDLSVAADVYSLGAVLYELLTGRPPFQAATPIDTILKVLQEEPVRPRQRDPEIDRDLETICLTCLAKEPARRYGSALRLAEDIDRHLAGEPIHARPVGTLERAVKWVRRRPAAAALLAVVVLSALGLTGYVLATNARLAHERRLADDNAAEADRQRRAAEDERRTALTLAGERDEQRKIAEDQKKDADDQRKAEAKARKDAETNARLALTSSQREKQERQRAEEKAKEAEEQRTEAVAARLLAQQKEQEAKRQGELAKQQSELVKKNFQERKEVIDDFLIRMDGRLAKEGAPVSIRLEFLNDALKLSQALIKEQEKDPAVRRQAARIYRAMADLWQKGDKTKEADDKYREALALQEQLVNEFPKEPAYRDDLAMTHAHRARLSAKTGRFEQAHEDYHKAISLLDKLVREHPKQPDYLEKAARYRFDLGNLLEQNDFDPEEAYREALKQQEQLAADVPNKPGYHADLALMANSLASYLDEQEKLDDAQRHFERALKARREAFRLAPHARGYGENLREAYSDLAAFLRQRGRHAALPPLAVALRQDLPDSGLDTYNAACMLADAARVVSSDEGLPEDQRKQLRQKYADEAVALLDKAVKEGFTDRGQFGKDKDLDPLRERPDFKALLADLDKRLPPQSLTPDKEFMALLRDHDAARQRYEDALARAQTAAQTKKAGALEPRFDEWAERFLAFAERHSQLPVAVEALSWVLETSPPTNPNNPEGAAYQLCERALKLLERDHFQRKELGDVCQRLAKLPLAQCDKLLRSAWERHEQRDVRGLAGWALVQSLLSQAEAARKRGENLEAMELTEKAEKQLGQLVKDFGAVPYGHVTLGEAAKDLLFELQHLSVGRPALEIEGEDLDGKKFKLSEYRGKVVVLDFWADWCGYCRQMYPQEKKLVEAYKDRPFALLGVNCDDTKAVPQRAVAKHGLNWRSWWDGGRAGDRIAKQWQIDGYPTIYVLDHKGVIRYKHIRGEELDAAVEKLVKECEAEQRDKK